MELLDSAEPVVNLLESTQGALACAPPYARKTKSLKAALPWLHLKGVSTGEMSEVLKMLEVLVDPEAK